MVTGRVVIFWEQSRRHPDQEIWLWILDQFGLMQPKFKVSGALGVGGGMHSLTW